MKKITLSLIFISTLGFAKAQKAGLPKLSGEGKVVQSFALPDYTNVNKTENTIDTAGRTAGAPFLPHFAGVSGIAQLVAYSGGGYIMGTMHDDAYAAQGIAFTGIAQGYKNVNHAQISVSEALILFGHIGKGPNHTASTAISVQLCTMAANAAYNTDNAGGAEKNSPGPYTIKSTTSLKIDDIVYPGYTSVSFATPYTGTSDFSILLDMSSIVAEVPNQKMVDTLGVLSDSKGDAADLDYCFSLIDTDPWVSDLIFSPSGSGDWDADAAIFAVVSVTTAVNEFVNGLKVYQASPNPAIDFTKITYGLEKDAKNVMLEVFSLTGERVFVSEESNKPAGTYSVEFSTKELAAGSYYYSLIANGTRLTKKLIVNK